MKGEVGMTKLGLIKVRLLFVGMVEGTIVSLKDDLGALSSFLNCISFSRKNFFTNMLKPALALKPTSHREVR